MNKLFLSFAIHFVCLLAAVSLGNSASAQSQTPKAVQVSPARGVYIADSDNYLVYHYRIDKNGELIHQAPQVVSTPYAACLSTDPLHHYLYVPSDFYLRPNLDGVIALFHITANGSIIPDKGAALEANVAAVRAGQTGAGQPISHPTRALLYTIGITNKLIPPLSRRPPRFEILVHSLRILPNGKLRRIGTLPIVCTNYGTLVFDSPGHYAYLPVDGKILEYRVAPNGEIVPLPGHAAKSVYSATAIITHPTKPYAYVVVGRKIAVYRIQADGELTPAPQVTGSVLILDKNLPTDNKLFAEPTGRFLYEVGPEGPLFGFRIRPSGLLDAVPFSALPGPLADPEIGFDPLLPVAHIIMGNALLQSYHIQADGKFVPAAPLPPRMVPPGSRFVNILVLSPRHR